MMKVLVTGASGRLGPYVSRRLWEAGHEVTGFDAVSPPESEDPAHFVSGDLTSLEDCLRALTYSEADAIVHLAALPSPLEMIRKPGWPRRQRGPEDTTMRVNTMGTYYLLDAARRLGTVQQVLFASSYYALGMGNRISGTPFQVDYLPIDEEHPLRPEDSYGLSKMFGEELIEGYARAYGIKGVAFRLMGVSYPHISWSQHYGVTPASDPDHVGGPVNTTYQYVDARDVANACVLALESRAELGDFEVFYLTTDTEYVEDTVELVARKWPDLAGMAHGIENTDGLITDAKVRRALGYVPQYSWREESEVGARSL